jgi:hypothetical protein
MLQIRARSARMGAAWVTVACLTLAVSSKAAEQPGGSEKADTSAAQQKAKAGADGVSRDEVGILKEQLAVQQQEIEQLRQALDDQKKLLQRVAASGTQGASIPPAFLPNAGQAPSLGQVASTTPIVPAVAKSTNAMGPLSGQPAGIGSAAGQVESKSAVPRAPLTLTIGDAEFTLGGFVDATAFFRSANLGSGIGTSFGSLPFSNTAAGHLTETRFSAQNSRFSILATSQVGHNNVKGYMETDFLGFQPGNAFVTSNSDSLRLRLYWVDVTRGKFEFLGGQSWSMLTPNRTGLSPTPGEIFYSQDMDTNYQVGLTWSRQLQFRFIYHPSKTWTAGVSIENAQQYVGSASALPFTNGAVVLPSASYASQVDVAQALSGVGGVSSIVNTTVPISTTNPTGTISQINSGGGGATATPNLVPDVVAKIAADPMVGDKHMHLEVAGLLSTFKLYNSSTKTTSSVAGGGGSVNLNLELFKNFHGIITSFYSDGGGRYIFGLGPDLIVRPDGTPSPVRAGSGIVGFEWQANKPTMFYGYYGGAYFYRNTAIDPTTGKFVGFGYPGSSSSANKSVQEGTFGIIQTFWKNPRYGALQLITQYSYVTRAPWSISSGSPKDAHLSMAYTNVRYVLP